MNKQLAESIQQLASVQGARFVSLTYRAKESGELARHNILLGVDVSKAYRADLAKYRRKLRKLDGVDKEACQELVDSLQESLTKGIGNNSAYTGKEAYESVLPGIKLHLESGDLHLNGFTRSKVVLEPGTYKQVKSSAKTIAKNGLRRLGKLGKFRQFKLTPENIQSVRVNGKTLEIS